MIISRCPFLSTRKKRERDFFSSPNPGPFLIISLSLSLLSGAHLIWPEREREREKKKKKKQFSFVQRRNPLSPRPDLLQHQVCVCTRTKKKLWLLLVTPGGTTMFFVFKFTHTHVFFLLLLNGKVNLQTRPSFSKRNEKSFWHIYGFRLVHKCLIGFVQWRRSPAALLVIPSSPERRYDHVRVSFSLSLFIF